MSGDAGKWRGLYVELMAKFCLERAIHRQEFNHVFTMSRLVGFSPSELRLLLCADQSPSWTREDILNYSETKLGYTRGFQRFINVLSGMNAKDRKTFLQLCMWSYVSQYHLDKSSPTFGDGRRKRLCILCFQST
jgi:hypothetical protein